MSNDLKNKLWVEKYRPVFIEDFIFCSKQMQRQILQMISDRNIPHLLFSGPPGCGKTTLASIIVSEIGIEPTDILLINASDENSVDTVRDKIKNFISAYSMSEFKVVRLEEVDHFTPAAQAILRVMMEEYADNVRFLLTCNYDNKIIPALKSRCQEYRFTLPSQAGVLTSIKQLLETENVEYDDIDLEQYVLAGLPDIRKIINTIQQNTVGNKLTGYEVSGSSDADYVFEVVECLNSCDWTKIRSIVNSSVSSGEWENFYKLMYDNISNATAFPTNTQKDEAILIIAEHLYKHAFVADPEINATAMIIRLTSISRK